MAEVVEKADTTAHDELVEFGEPSAAVPYTREEDKKYESLEPPPLSR